MGRALAGMGEREMYTCPTPEKLESCSNQQGGGEREDVLHSSLLASLGRAWAQRCGGRRNQRRFPTLLSYRPPCSAAEMFWVPPFASLGHPNRPINGWKKRSSELLLCHWTWEEGARFTPERAILLVCSWACQAHHGAGHLPGPNSSWEKRA